MLFPEVSQCSYKYSVTHHWAKITLHIQ